MDIKTEFAAAELATAAQLEAQYRELTQMESWTSVISLATGPLMILNPQRQVVIANTKLLQMLAGAAFSEVIGKRPGDLLHCEVAERTLLGCGTAAECRNCLALRTVQTAVEVDWARNQVSILTTSGHRVEMTLTASTLTTPSGRFTAVHFS